MSDAEIHALFCAHQRKGLISLDSQGDTLDFGYVDRQRSQSGTFLPNDSATPQAIQNAYSPTKRKTGISKPAAAAGGLVAAGLVGAALLKRKGKGLRLNPRTIDVPTTAHFSRRVMSPAPGQPALKRLVKRVRRGTIPTATGFGAMTVYSPEMQSLPTKKPSRADLQKMGVDPDTSLKAMRRATLERLKAMTQLSTKFEFDGLGKIAAEGLIDAAGISSATSPKKRRKVIVDARGNILNPNFLPDPGLKTLEDENSAAAQAQGTQFSALARAGSILAKYAPETGVIAGGDLIGETLHDKLKRKQKRQKGIQGGIEAVPSMGGAATTFQSVHDTVLEFDHGNQRIDKAKRSGLIAGAGVAGASIGAIGGLKYDQGKPVKNSDLKPGDRVYRRFGPGKVFQHSGVVDERGNVVHRTAGSSTYRSVKKGTFNKIGGKGPIFRETSSNDLPRKQAAQNATKAKGTTAGRYGCIGNNCQTASERIATKNRFPIGGQAKRALVGGALVGTKAALLTAAILHNRSQNNKKK